MGPALLSPPKEIRELDDNHDLDLDLDPACDDNADDAPPCHHANHSELGLPWLKSGCSEMELLAACVNAVDPASRALHGAEHLMSELDLDRSGLHRKARTEEPLLADAEPEHGRMDAGSHGSYFPLPGFVLALSKVSSQTFHHTQGC